MLFYAATATATAVAGAVGICRISIPDKLLLCSALPSVALYNLDYDGTQIRSDQIRSDLD